MQQPELASARAARLGSPKKKPFQWQKLLPLALVTPALTVLGTLILFPLFYSFRLSLHRWNVITPPRWVGVGNYLDIFGDRLFWQSMKITATLALVAFVLELVLGFALALLLHRDVPGKGFLRGLIMMPMMLTPVVLGVTWRVMLNLDFGVINYYLGQLGLPTRAWAVDAQTALWTVAVVDVWQFTSYVFLIMAAAMAALPEEPFEAAVIDGASTWQSLWYVMLPLLRPAILVVCLFRTIELLRIFDKVYTLTGGGPGRATETMSLHIFQQSFMGWQLGYGAAGSWILLLLTMGVAVLLIRALGKETAQ